MIQTKNEQTSDMLMCHHRNDVLATAPQLGLNQIWSLLFIVNCLLWIESSLSFPLFPFRWHSWWGKSRIPNEVQNMTYAGRNFGSLAATVCQCPLHESAPAAPKARNRNDICGKTWNLCNFLNIILDWLALFQMYVQTMYTDEWPSRGIPAAAQWNGLCGANLICGYGRTIPGFEQLCYAPELGDEEEQHREEWSLCEFPKVWRPLTGCEKTFPKTMRPCRGTKRGNHYISTAPHRVINTQYLLLICSDTAV